MRASIFLLFLLFTSPAPARPATETVDANRVTMFVLLEDATDATPGDLDARIADFTRAAASTRRRLQHQLPAASRFEPLPALNGWLLTVPAGTGDAARRTLLANAADIAHVSLHGVEAPLSYAVPGAEAAPVASAPVKATRRLSLGLIDLGTDRSHPLLAQVLGRTHFQPGTPGADGDGRLIRSHGTAMAGIYAQLVAGQALVAGGQAQPWLRLPRAVTITDTLVGHAGPETRAGRSDLLRALNWMMMAQDGRPRPDVIGYSQGNGRLCASGTACDATRWTGVTRVLDRLVDEQGVVFVKSAGNQGDGDDNTMTVPGDTWNGITVGNMHGFDWQRCTTGAVRSAHKIYRTSSVAPAADASRLLDLVAPGVRIQTTGVDPAYCRAVCGERADLGCAFCRRLGQQLPGHDGYWKANTGTSPAAAIVGAVALYLVDTGVRDPRAVKALLINSADAWTSDGAAHPQTRGNGHGCAADIDATRHGPWRYGSHYDRSYGYGYVNPAQAEAMRPHVLLDDIEDRHAQCYAGRLQPWDKITLVWHRHAAGGRGAAPGVLGLGLYEADTGTRVDADGLHRLDNVRQVSNGRGPGATPQARAVIVRVDARATERYALASARPLRKLPDCRTP